MSEWSQLEDWPGCRDDDGRKLLILHLAGIDTSSEQQDVTTASSIEGSRQLLACVLSSVSVVIPCAPRGHDLACRSMCDSLRMVVACLTELRIVTRHSAPHPARLEAVLCLPSLEQV